MKRIKNSETFLKHEIRSKNNNNNNIINYHLLFLSLSSLLFSFVFTPCIRLNHLYNRIFIWKQNKIGS